MDVVDVTNDFLLFKTNWKEYCHMRQGLSCLGFNRKQDLLVWHAMDTICRDDIGAGEILLCVTRPVGFSVV